MTGEGSNDEDIGPLWYTDAYPEAKIIEAWIALTKRYVNAPHVFAMDIKNEPNKATWGDGDPKTDWPAFCQRVGDAIHAINPNVLIGVAGKTEKVWSDHVGDAETKPVLLKIPDKVFYTPHFYIVPGQSESEMTAYLDKCVGNLAKANRPVLVGEWSWDEKKPEEVEWANRYMAYMSKAGLTNQFYWTLNESAKMNHGILFEKTIKVKEDKVVALKKLQGEATKITFAPKQ
jgi:endoglucanase